jgi:hypothetical protein
VTKHSRGTFRARVMHHSLPSGIKRAQGMPGAGRTHGPPATKKQAAVTTGTPQQPAFPAQWFDGVYVLSLVYRAF